MRLELTKRADYAIRAALALAAREGEWLSATRIAEDQDVPVRFLGVVMGDLARAGIVAGLPGRAGGYRLARPATDIHLLSVVEAVEGDSRRERCVLRGGPCGISGVCSVHEVFAAAQAELLERFSGTTLAALAAGPRVD